MAEDKYKDLDIEIEFIDNKIKEFCGNKITIDCEDNGQTITYKFIGQDIDFMLSVHRKKGKLITLQYKIGKDLDKSKELADYILETDKLGYKPKYNTSWNINLKKGKFEDLIHLLKCSNEMVKIQEDKEFDYYRQLRCKGITGDTLVIKYFFNKNKMQIQGKQLDLFKLIQELIIDTEDDGIYEELLTANLSLGEVKVKKEDVDQDLKFILGNDLYNFIPSNLKLLLGNSYVLKNMEGDFMEYSFILLPISRCLEGYLLKILTNFNIEVDLTDTNFGEVFKKDEYSNNYLIRSKYSERFDKYPELKDKIEDIYLTYVKTRHPYAHGDCYDFKISIIEDKKEAIAKVNEVISCMKESYDVYSKI